MYVYLLISLSVIKLPKRTFPTPARNKLALPVDSRAVSQRSLRKTVAADSTGVGEKARPELQPRTLSTTPRFCSRFFRSAFLSRTSAKKHRHFYRNNRERRRKRERERTGREEKRTGNEKLDKNLRNTTRLFLRLGVFTKIESSLSLCLSFSVFSRSLEIDPLRSTFAEYSNETGSTGRSNKGCTVYGRIYPGWLLLWRDQRTSSQTPTTF